MPSLIRYYLDVLKKAIIIHRNCNACLGEWPFTCFITSLADWPCAEVSPAT